MARAGDSEQSMEDILASIRRIIADDVPPPRDPAAPASPALDVLELTEIAEPEAPPPEPVRASSLPATDLSAHPAGASAIEGMVRELLRPLLREWLDANLPGIVERAVGDEVRRVAGRG